MRAPMLMIRVAILLITSILGTWNASAFEGKVLLDSLQTEKGEVIDYEVTNLQSVELRWKLPCKKVGDGATPVYCLGLLDGEGNLRIRCDVAVNYGGVKFGFNDEKFEDVAVMARVATYDKAGAINDSANIALEKISPFHFSSLKLSLAGNAVTLLAGKREYKMLHTSGFAQEIDRVTLNADIPLEIAALYVSADSARTNLRLMTEMDSEWVAQRMREGCGNAHEGIYSYLDSELDDSKMGKGGDYRLYLHPTASGGYDLIYLEGAKSNSDFWKDGMKKGEMKPTIFQDHYNLVWYDANGDSDFEELWAEFIDGMILSLHFPLEKAQLRFYRATTQ